MWTKIGLTATCTLAWLNPSSNPATEPVAPHGLMVCRQTEGGITAIDTSKYYVWMPLKDDGEPDKTRVFGKGIVVTYNQAKCLIEVVKEDPK